MSIEPSAWCECSGRMLVFGATQRHCSGRMLVVDAAQYDCSGRMLVVGATQRHCSGRMLVVGVDMYIGTGLHCSRLFLVVASAQRIVTDALARILHCPWYHRRRPIVASYPGDSLLIVFLETMQLLTLM